MQEPQKMWVRFLGQEDPLEEDMATYSSILAWRIPWTEETGGLSLSVHRIAESATTEATEHTHTHTVGPYQLSILYIVACMMQKTQVQSLGQKIPGGGHGNPLQYSYLENPMDRGAW